MTDAEPTIAKGDELLSWEEMSARYAGARIKLLPGSNHALDDFDEHLAEVIGFLGLGALGGNASAEPLSGSSG